MTENADATEPLSPEAEALRAEAAERDALFARRAVQRAPYAANAMGAMSFLAVVVLLLLYGYYRLDRAEPSGTPYQARLERMVNLEAADRFEAESGSAPRYAPEWPSRMYERLRTDAMLFACAAVVLAWTFARRERARAVRLVAARDRELRDEIDALRRRVQALDGKDKPSDAGGDGTGAP